MSHSLSRLCQEVGGQEEQVNALEKGLESRQTKMKKHVLSCVHGEVTAGGCISLK